MAMRFKVEIDGAAARARTSLLQGQDFSMLDAVKGVEAFAYEDGLCYPQRPRQRERLER